jgi:ADP-ribose pyrophosphatase YjhB (NUDIX family)
MRIRGTAVVFRNGKVLLVRDNGHHRFSLPGGGVKHNEPPLAAAIREL